jgi:alpha-N-arabinofuranosidase
MIPNPKTRKPSCTALNLLAYTKLWLLIFLMAAHDISAQPTNTPTAPTGESTNSVPRLLIKVDEATATVSPSLYGLMTEEINYSYEGGLYGELVRNRSFKAHATNAVYWDLVQEGKATGAMSLDPSTPLNEALNTSLKLEITHAKQKERVGIANAGYWGIPVKPKTQYRASLYAKADGFKGPLTVAIVSRNQGTVLTSATIRSITRDWQKYEVKLTTKAVPESKDNQLIIWAGAPGKIWLSQVSLFPPTWRDRTNGNRPDIMQILADMKPSFLRFPGGNYVEGNTIQTRFDWKKTIGDPAHRPGHMNDAWHYWSTDGMGLLEFLEWCEDLDMKPVLAVYAGYSLRQQHVEPGPDLESYVRDALDEIEYVTGDNKTVWGARRALEGHPAPFDLKYVEVGNEDWFDRSGTYDRRFAQFYDAIKAKYPSLQIIATTPVTNRTTDVIDEHFYRSQDDMEAHAHDYDKRSRSGPKVFVGEWATRIGYPTPNMAGALGDAAWMTGMERNSDLVIMSCYAPLFVNVNPGGMQWRTDLIGYDALRSYGSPAYYAQKMFNLNHGDVVLKVSDENVGSREWQPPARRRNGVEQPPPPPRQVPTLFFEATRDTKSGTVYLKVVNPKGEPQSVQVDLQGCSNVASEGQLIQLSAKAKEETNTIDDPDHIVPVTSKVDGLGTNFTRTFPPYSISILLIKTK